MKKCSICKKEKEVSEFYKDKRRKSGLYSCCRECHNKEYKNTDEKKEYMKNWRIKNKESIRIYKRNYNRIYIKNARKKPKFRIDSIMGTALWFCLRSKKSGKKWETLVGYSAKELMCHLEKRFDNNMTWDNHGTYWEIDHIKPKSLFKYETTDDQEFRKCWALENLQPLEKSLNRQKRNKFN